MPANTTGNRYSAIDSSDPNPGSLKIEGEFVAMAASRRSSTKSTPDMITKSTPNNNTAERAMVRLASRPIKIASGNTNEKATRAQNSNSRRGRGGGAGGGGEA